MTMADFGEAHSSARTLPNMQYGTIISYTGALRLSAFGTSILNTVTRASAQTESAGYVIYVSTPDAVSVSPYPGWLLSGFRFILAVGLIALVAIVVSLVAGTTIAALVFGSVFGAALIVGGHIILVAERLEKQSQ